MTNKYLPITDHVYFNGFSFRVRFIKNGIKYTKNFLTRRTAIKYKNKHVN